MICAELVTIGAVPVWSPTASQPADMSTCAAVVMVGTDTSALSVFAFPEPALAAQAWSYGAVCVVLSYLLAWGVGAVLSMLDSKG